MKMKGKVYRTVVRPAMIYGAETWAVKMVHEKRLEVAEMRMLRWSCGVTRLDRIRNEVINKIKVSNGGFEESPGKKNAVVWTCSKKRGKLCRKES